MKTPFYLILLLVLSFIVSSDCGKSNSTEAQIPLISQETKDAELVEAVKVRDIDKARKLLKDGANPDIVYKESKENNIYLTVLRTAVVNKDLETAKLLLSHNSNVNLSTIIYDNNIRYEYNDNFREATFNQDLPMMKLLADYQIDMKKDEDFAPLIVYAVRNKETLDFLVELGFDISIIDKSEGRTALIEAVLADDVNLVKAILKHKPKNLEAKTYGLKVFDFQKLTALQIAEIHKNKEIIKLLKKAGARK